MSNVSTDRAKSIDSTTSSMPTKLNENIYSPFSNVVENVPSSFVANFLIPTFGDELSATEIVAYGKPSLSEDTNFPFTVMC